MDEGGRIDAARTQNLFREVNERINELSGEGEAVGELICECGEKDCTEVILLTRDEYEGVRRVPTHFAVVADHEIPDIERVVERHDRYLVVEKVGEAATEALEHDPRDRGTRRTAEGAP